MEGSDLYEYTSGRWLWNEELRRSERRRLFNVTAFKRLAAASINQKLEDIVQFDKLAEGGFNRTFLVSMRDGTRIVGRIPYTATEPKQLLVASEVATVEFLRSHGIPTPKVYSYSATADNPVGTEYIFMEFIRGRNLGDIWFDMPEKARITVVTKLVDIESRLFALRFPASGSLYYAQDLPAESPQVVVPSANPAGEGRYCIGPELTLALWYGKRRNLEIFRGPYESPHAVLTAGAQKELAYLAQFGQPLQPFQRLRGEIYNYEKLSHLEHMNSLKDYLRVAPHLVPEKSETLTSPTIRHPDLQPNNVFVSDDLEITGLIDWQHTAILPLFLQCGIPNSIQNYGDSVSESLAVPKLPPGFDDMSEIEQFKQVELLRKRQLHYFYITKTAELNPVHFRALLDEVCILRRKLFHHASDPWEGDNATLKADLIQLVRDWPQIIRSKSGIENGVATPCPITFSADEMEECSRLVTAQAEADDQLQACMNVVGVGREGWVPLEQYEEAKRRDCKLRADALEEAESDEDKERIGEDWIFGDFDEEKYS